MLAPVSHLCPPSSIIKIYEKEPVLIQTYVTETLFAKESKLCNISHSLSSKIWWACFAHYLTFP